MLTVEHYLEVYRTRHQMQEKGITNPPEEIKKFTREFVEALETMPLDAPIMLKDGTFYDSTGNLIMRIPD